MRFLLRQEYHVYPRITRPFLAAWRRCCGKGVQLAEVTAADGIESLEAGPSAAAGLVIEPIRVAASESVARWTGTSKVDICCAIQAGTLSAKKTDDGGFAIDPADLVDYRMPQAR